MQSFIEFINNIIVSIVSSIEALGLNVDYINWLVGKVGLILSGCLTIITIVVFIYIYIKSIHYNPFYNTYHQNAFFRNKISGILGLLITIASIWMLFSVIYILIK